MIYTDTFIVPKNRNIEEYIRNQINLNFVDFVEIENVILRYAIVKVNDNTFEVEASILGNGETFDRNRNIPYEPNNKFVVVNVVPTGVRAEVGGYIADATPVTNVLANICDKVVVHPNVVNGSFLNYMRDNVVYTEGFILDNFLRNEIALSEVISNKIGVIIDRGAIDEDLQCLSEIINTIESLRVIVGIDCIGYTITKESIGGKAIQMRSNTFCGEVKNPDTMLEATQKLILKGATAIAIVTHIEIDNMEKDLDKYFKGNLANPFGGTEALISHTISKIFNLPCAHAPALSKAEKEYYNSVGIVDPRASSEVVSSSYLGCILKGLHKAPQIGNTGITLSDVKAIIVPHSCCGGIPALMSQKFNIPLIAVKENKTVLDVTPEKMGMNAIIVENYWEAVGVVAALKSGISIDSLRRPIKSIREI